MNRSDAILRIAWCSVVTRSWELIEDNAKDKRVRTYLFPFWGIQFQRWSEGYGEGFIFSRFTLLWLMRQVFLTCPSDGERLNSQKQMEVFGEACLIANDLAAFEFPKPLPTDVAVAANLMPQTEYCSQEDYSRDIARTLCLLNDIAPNAMGTTFPELAKKLQDLLEFGLTEYCDLAFASAMRPLAADTESIENFKIVTLAPGDFATTSIAPATAEQFLNSISAEEQDIREHIIGATSHDCDLTVFRDRPFLRRGAEFVPLDIGFVLDKAGRSLFWTALKRCPQRDREALLQQWGELFERYVSTVFASSLGSAGGAFFDSPIFQDRAQVADGAIREGTTLILMEYKASAVKNAIKYADDPAELERLLESRFVQGEGGARKGLAQLSNAIKRFAEGNIIIDRSTGAKIVPDEIRTVIPVLIHLDNALRTPGIPNYMATRFKSLGRRKRFCVTPLVLIPITELEELEGHLCETHLCRFLESFMTVLRSDRAAVFFTRLLPILKGKLRKNGVTLERMNAFMDGMLERLFPGGVEADLQSSSVRTGRREDHEPA